MFNKDWPNYVRFAVANTATRIVFLGLEKSEQQMRNDFTLRNKFLVSSRPGAGALKYNKAIPHHDISKITASWGSPEKRGQGDLEFLEEQEEGFLQKKFTPATYARKGSNRGKTIRNNLRRRAIEIMDSRGFGGKNDEQTMLFFLRQAYINGYGMPGSKQFMYIHNNEFGPFREGLYQFKSRGIGGGNQFPEIQAVYYKKDKKGQRRAAVHWMEKSKNKITQADIDKAYIEEAKRSFTKQITRMR